MACSGTSRSAAFDFSCRNALGWILMNRPKFPLLMTSLARSPQISPERIPVSRPKRRALESTLLFGLQQCHYLFICQDLMGVDLWLFSDAEVFPRVVAEFSLFHAPLEELQHVLPEPSLGLRSKDPVRLHLFGELYQFSETCLLSLPVFADIGRELADQG